jgi:transglutaminase-like putative cysteine protease
MTLERMVQIGVAAMVALGAALLGMGEFNAAVPIHAPILGFVAAVSSVYVVDIRGWIRLTRWQANTAGLAALAICAFELRHVSAESRVLALANLLLYLECVLLYRRKDEATWWLLALLSLLDVAVSAALSDDLLFGTLLATYFFVGLLTLALFLVYREAQPGPPLPAAELPFFQQPLFRWKRRKPRPAAADYETLAPRDPPVPEPYLLLKLVARRLAALALAATAVTAALFVLVPRVGRSAWTQPVESQQLTVGFSDRVSLGELGETIEDPQEVMQVRFIDHRSQQEKMLVSPPLLRGALLTDYTGDAWRTRTTDDNAVGGIVRRPPSGATELVEQHVTIEPLDTDALFAVFPVYSLGGGQDVLFDDGSERLSRRNRRNRPTYQLLTTALNGGRQAEIVPALYRPPPELGELTSVQRDVLPGLVRTAAEAVAGIPAEDVYGRAKALSRHLRASGRYVYSSVLPPRPDEDADMDSLEYFVTRSRSGHCEYFSSALTLMLRSQGIPARMAVGFQGGDYNPLGRFYQVRQLHAHSWVEAYLERSQFPAGADLGRAGGGWLTLDPTPGTDTETVAQAEARWPTPGEVVAFVKFLWTSYVVGMTADKQRQKIYRPILASLQTAYQRLTARSTWDAVARGLRSLVAGHRPDDSAQEAMVLVGGLVIGVPLAGVASWLAVQGLRRLRNGRRGSVGGRRAVRRAEPVDVPFYRRLESLLAAEGLVRPAGQTQREFALSVGGQLADRAGTQPSAGLPRQVAEAFYRVRFGRQALDKREAQAVEQALGSLAEALKQSA